MLETHNADVTTKLREERDKYDALLAARLEIDE